MTDFFELLKKRRSIRDFENKKVPLEIINEIIKESCLAPSSGNGCVLVNSVTEGTTK